MERRGELRVPRRRFSRANRLTFFDMTCFRLQITGRVQGVGFRYALQAEAARLGVAGWVRNRRDGSVEALAQGEARAVQALLDWARRGPPGARVDALSSAPAEAQAGLAGFELRPTA
jgi:acylphosphatase